MNQPDKIALFERQGDGSTLIRGTGFGAIGQFAWAELVPSGALIPTAKEAIARQALEAMGYLVRDAAAPAEPTPERSRRMPLPLPECSRCHAPYRRDYRPGLGETCTECGGHLELIQHDPNAPDNRDPDSHCPVCTREVKRHWKFCRCGQPLTKAQQLDFDDELGDVDRRPWHQRYAADLARSRSSSLRELAADLFAMPEGTDQ